MHLRGLLGVPAMVLAGCSILYNPDNLESTDAAVIDAPIDAPTDADPNVFSISGVEPTAIDEGVGAANGRPALFILQGFSLIGDTANVSLQIMDMPTAVPTLVDFAIADNATQGGVAIRIPVIPELAEGATATLRISVTQSGVTETEDVMIRGRDELTLTSAAQPELVNGQLYSQITVPAAANVHFAGADVIRLRATAGITIDGVVDGDAIGATPGPHGCLGGGSDSPGNCSTGGGRQGASAAMLSLNAGSGGGGGAFGAVATGGSGAMAGMPGMPTGNEMLVPIESAVDQEGNRGNGGGGGGAGLLNAPGGVGGAGGGVLYVKAGGDITVGAMGALRVRGGNGTVANNSGGGGGSGGALLVRAGGTIMSTTRWLSAPAGTGGIGGGQVNGGGAGSAGRIRVDTGGGDVTAMANNPNPVQGPAWSSTVAHTSETAQFTAQLRGRPQTAFGIELNDVSIGDAMTGLSGTVNVNMTLRPGKNTLCALAAAGGAEEAVTCVDVFYSGD